MLKNNKSIPIILLLLFPALSNLVKHSGSIILVILILLGFYSWITRDESSSFEKSEKQIMFAFALYFFVSLVFFLANGILREDASFHWSLDHEIRLLAIAPVLFLFNHSRIKPWVIWYSTTAAAILCGLYSIIYIYLISAGARATGAYHPISFGEISLVYGFISLTGARYFYEKKSVYLLLPFLAVVLGVMASFLSGTRGAIITIPFLTGIFFLQLGSFRHPWRNRFFLIATIIIMTVGLFNLPGSSLEKRFRTGITQAKAFKNGEGTGHYVVRLAMWTEAWRIFKQYPFTGTGKGGYYKIVSQRIADHETPEIIRTYKTPHNMYLENMANYGIFGFCILLILFLTPLNAFINAAKKYNEQAREMAYGGIMFITAFMLFAVTESIFKRNIYIAIYIIMVAALLSVINLLQKNEDNLYA